MVTVGPHFVGVRADESAGLVVQLVMGLKKWLWLDEGKRMRGEVFFDWFKFTHFVWVGGVGLEGPSEWMKQMGTDSQSLWATIP